MGITAFRQRSLATAVEVDGPFVPLAQGISQLL